MTQHGLDPKAWKTAATLSATVMRTVADIPREIDSSPVSEQSQAGPSEAFMLNLMARARDINSPHAQQLIIAAVRQFVTQEDLSGRHPHKVPNIQTCIFLMLKEKLHQVPWLARDVLDYARDVSHQGQAVTATTWGGPPQGLGPLAPATPHHPLHRPMEPNPENTGRQLQGLALRRNRIRP